MLNDTVTQQYLLTMQIIKTLMRKLKVVLMGPLAKPYDTFLALGHPAINKDNATPGQVCKEQYLTHSMTSEPHFESTLKCGWPSSQNFKFFNIGDCFRGSCRYRNVSLQVYTLNRFLHTQTIYRYLGL